MNGHSSCRWGGHYLVAFIPYFLTPCLYLSHMSRISAVLNLIFSIYIFLEWSDRKVVERAETTEDEVHDDNIEVEDVESDNTVEEKKLAIKTQTVRKVSKGQH